LRGSNVIKGFETALTGYVTDDWQATLGYALHGRAYWQRYQLLDRRGSAASDDSEGQPRPARAVQPGVLREQIPHRSDVERRARHYLLLGFLCSVDDFVKRPGFVRLDAALYMKINETWSGQLNVENIFNTGFGRWQQ
jgi:catecholate siderophore receptor